MSLKEYIKEHIKESFEIKQKVYENEEIIGIIEEVANKAVEIYKNKGKILIAGNGGSAADAQHIAGELVSKFYFDREGLPAVALTTDTSIMTAIGNDYGYDKLFSRQLQANGNENDMFIGISTSGNSPNIIKAFEECKKRGIISVGLTGKSGGKMVHSCDYCINVPSDQTPRIQEMHILIGHIICAIIEKEIFKGVDK